MVRRLTARGLKLNEVAVCVNVSLAGCCDAFLTFGWGNYEILCVLGTLILVTYRGQFVPYGRGQKLVSGPGGQYLVSGPWATIWPPDFPST